MSKPKSLSNRTLRKLVEELDSCGNADRDRRTEIEKTLQRDYSLPAFLKNPAFRGDQTELVVGSDVQMVSLNTQTGVLRGMANLNSGFRPRRADVCGALAFNKRNRILCVLNADTDVNGLVECDEFENYPSLSFRCLTRFFHDKATDRNRGEAAGMLYDRLVVLDFSPDHTIKMTPAQHSEAQKAANMGRVQSLRSPHIGYTAGRTDYGPAKFIWHRPSTILIKDTHSGGKTYLFGQDEDTYFGCELADDPKTLKSAFKSLMAPAARGKEGVLRQGEWFAVPTATTDVPQEKDCVFVADGGLLPRESDDSNSHWLHTDRCNNIRVGPDGLVYAKDFYVSHDEHLDMRGKGNQWYVFHRNTAVRSFSEDGVD